MVASLRYILIKNIFAVCFEYRLELHLLTNLFWTGGRHAETQKAASRQRCGTKADRQLAGRKAGKHAESRQKDGIKASGRNKDGQICGRHIGSRQAES